MVNPFMSALEKTLSGDLIPNELNEVMPTSISAPAGFTYRLKLKFSDADTGALQENDFFVPL